MPADLLHDKRISWRVHPNGVRQLQVRHLAYPTEMPMLPLCWVSIPTLEQAGVVFETSEVASTHVFPALGSVSAPNRG